MVAESSASPRQRVVPLGAFSPVAARTSRQHIQHEQQSPAQHPARARPEPADLGRSAGCYPTCSTLSRAAHRASTPACSCKR
eukprot:1836438-Rhodomonas_salina.2